MAYKLKFTGATSSSTTAERVDLASSITLNANTGTDNLRVEIEFELDSLSATNTLCFAANFCRFQILNTGQISVQYRNQTNSLAAVTSATGVVSVGVRYVLALELSNVDRNARIFLNDVEVGMVASRWGTFTVDRFGLWPENSTFNGSLYRATCYQNNVIVNDYDPSASNGTGTTLIDTIGGNNGTLVNFPTDNSQWVFYESGGAANESTVSYDLGAIDYAVSGQITAPAITATVSYDIGAIDYAVIAQQLAPGNSASLSYDIGAISYEVSAQQSAPQFSASVGYEIGGVGFAVQANTGTPVNMATAAYDLGSIGYSVSAQSIAPQLSASLEYDIGSIDYAISANTGAPIRAATIGYDIGGISWQVNAQWQPSDALAIIGYDIGSIGFLVQARSGDVVVSSASDAGLSFKELARGLSFKEQPRGIKFTEPQRGVRV